MSPVDPNVRATADFLLTDIDTALTFVRLADSEDHDSEKKLRNQSNARKAYDTVQRLLLRLHLPPEEQSKINEKLSQLKVELEGLGEHF